MNLYLFIFYSKIKKKRKGVEVTLYFNQMPIYIVSFKFYLDNIQDAHTFGSSK